MASATVDQQPFRFLDLPAELRCCVYKQIEFSTTWHVLDRAEAYFSKREWPVPPKAHLCDSRVTLIRPHVPLGILTSCRLVKDEAREILKRKAEHCKLQPIRYLVDYSAALALATPSGALKSCLAVAGWSFDKDTNRTVMDFIQLCMYHLIQMSRPRTPGGPRGIRAIEITINHKSGVAYGMGVMKAVSKLAKLKFYRPTRLVVIYKSPLPEIMIPGDTQTHDSSRIKAFLQNVPTESKSGDEASSELGVFVRPLEEKAFDKHVEGLEWY